MVKNPILKTVLLFLTKLCFSYYICQVVTEVICVNHMTSLSVLSYVAFDFHKECSHMRWERLQILVDAVSETQDEYG